MDAPTYIANYADAVAVGNTLAYLPLELRQIIFEYVAIAHINNNRLTGLIEAADVRPGRKNSWLPPMCHVNDDFFVEALPMFLKHVNIVVREVYTAHNLKFFLEATKTFSNVHTLRFASTKALRPLSAGAELLSKCTGLRHSKIAIRRKDFRLYSTPAAGSSASEDPHEQQGHLKMKAVTDEFPFRQILSLVNLEKITLFLVDSDRHSLPEGSSTCWELGPWLAKKLRGRGRKTEINCMFGDADYLSEALSELHPDPRDPKGMWILRLRPQHYQCRSDYVTERPVFCRVRGH